jgi:release factor glutamine methyltransferase
MSLSPASLLSFSSVTARLRAAGCVFAEDEARLLLSAAAEREELQAMIDRRAAGLPLEQVLGWAEFCGLRITVDPGVFVPRRRTEFLARRATELAPPDAVTVDLCCGTGALGAAVAVAVDGRATLHATDVDPAAVACARRNVTAAGGRVYEGDLYAALPPSLCARVDLLLANVPYVPTEELALLPAEARLHEARTALDGGADGLDVLRRVAAEAPAWLAPGGRLLFETGEHQAWAAVDVVTAAGLRAEVAVSEELFATVVTATKPPGRAAEQ